MLYGIHNIYDAGPFDFLNLIHNATLVLTDSFHGTVFSVIIEKEFYYIADVNEKGQPQRDDRIDDFLQKVDMTTYTVSVMEPETRIAIGQKRSYSHALELINTMRSKAIKYLTDSIR